MHNARSLHRDNNVNNVFQDSLRTRLLLGSRKAFLLSLSLKKVTDIPTHRDSKMFQLAFLTLWAGEQSFCPLPSSLFDVNIKLHQEYGKKIFNNKVVQIFVKNIIFNTPYKY